MTPETILAVMLSQPIWYGDRDMPADERLELLRPVAAEIAKVSRDAIEAAGMVTLGFAESGWASPVLRGHCHAMPKGQQCDNGRARGAWQVHDVGLCREAWTRPAGTPEALAAEAQCTIRTLRGSRSRCRDGWRGAFAGFARGASCTWAPAAKRVEMMGAVLVRLRAGEP